MEKTTSGRNITKNKKIWHKINKNVIKTEKESNAWVSVKNIKEFLEISTIDTCFFSSIIKSEDFI